MNIEITRKDSVHVLNWLNHYQTLCKKHGFAYLESDIENVMQNLASQFKQNGLNPIRRNEIPCWQWKSLPDNWFLLDS